MTSSDTPTNLVLGAAGTAAAWGLADVNTLVSIVAGIATAIYMTLCAYHKFQDCKERKAKAKKQP